MPPGPAAGRYRRPPHCARQAPAAAGGCLHDLDQRRNHVPAEHAASGGAAKARRSRAAACQHRWAEARWSEEACCCAEAAPTSSAAAEHRPDERPDPPGAEQKDFDELGEGIELQAFVSAARASRAAYSERAVPDIPGRSSGRTCIQGLRKAGDLAKEQGVYLDTEGARIRWRRRPSRSRPQWRPSTWSKPRRTRTCAWISTSTTCSMS